MLVYFYIDLTFFFKFHAWILYLYHFCPSLSPQLPPPSPLPLKLMIYFYYHCHIYICIYKYNQLSPLSVVYMCLELIIWNQLTYQGESLEKTGSPSISRHLLFLYFIIDHNILQITHVFSLKNPAPRYIPTNVIIYLSILAIIWLKYHLEEIKWNKTCNYFRVLILFILCFCTYANINEFYIHVQVHSCHVWGSEGRHIWRSEDNIHEESFFLSTLWISGIELKWLGLAGIEPFTKPKTCKFLTLCVI